MLLRFLTEESLSKDNVDLWKLLLDNPRLASPLLLMLFQEKIVWTCAEYVSNIYWLHRTLKLKLLVLQDYIQYVSLHCLYHIVCNLKWLGLVFRDNMAFIIRSYCVSQNHVDAIFPWSFVMLSFWQCSVSFLSLVYFA